jgi:hypothetical protein
MVYATRITLEVSIDHPHACVASLCQEDHVMISRVLDGWAFLCAQDLAKRYGSKPLQWPVHVVEQLTARNTAILTAIEEQIGAMPPSLFHPLGTSLQLPGHPVCSCSSLASHGSRCWQRNL